MTRARELAELAAAYDSGGLSNMKNRIINGNMVIDQRNAGASSNPSTDGGYWTVDRWRTFRSQANKYTIQQNAGAVTPPAGFGFYLGVTSSSAYSILSNDYFMLNTRVEGFNWADLNWGTASASAATLSFWVRSSLTGTFGGSITNGVENYSYPFTYTINSANTWEYKTVTISGPTAGTWVGATNGIGVSVWLGLGIGSSNSGPAGSWASATYYGATGATSVVGTNGATFYITGVQLEKGSTATSFDYRPYGTELALCQRYYQKVSCDDSDTLAVATAFNATDVYGVYNFKVSMRADPTGSASANNALGYLTNGISQTSTLIAFQLSSANQIEISTTQSGRTGGTAGWWRFVGAGWVAFSAEL